MSNTVKVKKYLDIIEEYVAQEILTPGHLIELRSDGKVQKHTGEDENVMPMFALEDELQGRAIDTNYAATDPVQCWIPTRGDQVNALLKANENIVVGDWLTSAGDGTLKKLAAALASDVDDIYSQRLVGIALEASNESTVQRILVRIV